jgi:hypothetical protein
MKTMVFFELERSAKKSGGDRYTEVKALAEDGSAAATQAFGQIYVNQHYSREAGRPRKSICVQLITE